MRSGQMKQKLVMILFLLSFILVVEGIPQDAESPWNRLQHNTTPIVLSFMSPAQARDKFIVCPSTVVIPGLSKDMEYIVDISRIKTLLEEAGIAEPVTIELCKTEKRKKRLFAGLGTYKPGISGEEKTITWPMPKYKPVAVPRAEIHALAAELHRRGGLLDNPQLGVEDNWILEFKDADGNNKAALEANGYVFLRYEKQQYGELDRLLAANQETAALTYCKKLKGNLRDEAFNILGTALFLEEIYRLGEKGDYNAVEAYCQKQKDELRSQCYRLAGEACFKQKEYQRAIEYFSRAELPESNNKIGLALYLLEEYPKAVEYYEKGYPGADRARAFSRLADHYKARGEDAPAKTYYKKALQEYEYLIKDNEYIWNDPDNNDRLRCRREIATFAKSPEELAKEEKLKAILAQTAAYCQKLEQVMIHFFCKEDILEVYPTGSGKQARNTFVYEYQLIQEGKSINERRILLKKNGQQRRTEDAQLETSLYQYNKLIFGPIGFLDKFWQDYFDYKIVKEETYNGQPVVVIEAIPLRQLKSNFICGQIWVNAQDYGILKIQWEPKFFLNNFQRAVEDAKWHNARLQLDFISEFNKERNGIRFPSRYYIAEHHVYEDGNRKNIALLDVKFRDFMFFTVGTDVSYD